MRCTVAPWSSSLVLRAYKPLTAFTSLCLESAVCSRYYQLVRVNKEPSHFLYFSSVTQCHSDILSLLITQVRQCHCLNTLCLTCKLSTLPLNTLCHLSKHPYMWMWLCTPSLSHIRPKYNRLLRRRKALKLHILLIGSKCLKVLVTIAVILEAPELKVSFDVFSRTTSGNYSGIISRHCWLGNSTAIFNSLFIAACRYWKARSLEVGLAM